MPLSIYIYALLLFDFFFEDWDRGGAQFTVDNDQSAIWLSETVRIKKLQYNLCTGVVHGERGKMLFSLFLKT